MCEVGRRVEKNYPMYTSAHGGLLNRCLPKSILHLFFSLASFKAALDNTIDMVRAFSLCCGGRSKQKTSEDPLHSESECKGLHVFGEKCKHHPNQKGNSGTASNKCVAEKQRRCKVKRQCSMEQRTVDLQLNTTW